MTTLRRITVGEGLSAPLGPYSHAITVGDYLHMSGQVAINVRGELVGEHDFETQARQVYENIGAVLRAAGVGFDRVVKMTVFLTDMSTLPIASRVRREFFAVDMYPASTVVQVVQLGDPAWMIEVEGLAFIGALGTDVND